MVQNFLRHIDACTRHDPAAFVPFCIANKQPGWVRRDFLPLITSVKGFAFDGAALRLCPASDTPEERTQALNEATAVLSAHFNVPPRAEIYPVVEQWGEEPLAEIDRAAIPWFGTPGFGVHVNGYVRQPDGLYLWIAERAMDREIDPGKLDNMIGGGLPLGLTIEENFAKEAWEEAGLTPDIVAQGQRVATLHYRVDMMKGVRNDTLFVFDLEMPATLIPRNTDGEVGAFTLMPAAKVVDIVAQTDRFKFNCNLVLIDFFLRHGLIGPAHPAYDSLFAALNPIRA